MNKKRIYITLGIILTAILVSVLLQINISHDYSSNKPELDIESNTNIKIPDKKREFLKVLVGLESKNMKIEDNPLRIEGTFVVPQDTVLNGIKYYLKTSKNKDIKDVEINLESEKMKIKAKYNLFGKFKTPVEMSVVPFLTENSDIRLDLKDIRVLNLKINQKLIDSIINNWFSDQKGISVDDGDVIIDKRNFKGVSLNDLLIKSSNLVINLSINLD